MSFEAAFVIAWNPELLAKTLEIKEYKRSRITLKKNKDNIEIKIIADDAVAFRASVNNVMQTIKICQDMEAVK